MVKVHADRDVCISAGNCVMGANAVLDQDDDGIVVVLVDEVPDEELESRCRSITPARTSSKALTTSTHTGKASVIHMLRSLTTISPSATR